MVRKSTKTNKSQKSTVAENNKLLSPEQKLAYDTLLSNINCMQDLLYDDINNNNLITGFKGFVKQLIEKKMIVNKNDKLNQSCARVMQEFNIYDLNCRVIFYKLHQCNGKQKQTTQRYKIWIYHIYEITQRGLKFLFSFLWCEIGRNNNDEKNKICSINYDKNVNDDNSSHHLITLNDLEFLRIYMEPNIANEIFGYEL